MQNCVKNTASLQVQGAHLDFNAKILLENILCQTEKDTCALTQSASCPGSDAICKLPSTADNFELGDKIIYSQWVTIDCSILITVVVLSEEIINDLASKI
jgi:hypothetical protein